MWEIVFRGKRVDNGEWVYGVPIKKYGKTYIIDVGQSFLYSTYHKKSVNDFLTRVYEVVPKTVGQYTGLTDKNGKKIFEGDILKIYPDCDYLEDFEISKVYSYNGVLCVDYHTSEYDATAIGFAYDIDETEFEVIGNIHDNPELLEVK